jgi:hypothetical protein
LITSTLSRGNLSFNTLITKEVQQQIDDAFSQDECFPYFFLAKDCKMIRQLDWINTGTASVWLAWLVYLPAQFFPCSDPLLFLNILKTPKAIVDYLDQNDQGVVDLRIDSMLLSLLPRLLVKERELHPI